ncbi:MFS general substrate transporter [Favolaschia claudopus]|uniref:MFS general substrate transporter n=1 Tax=Favolaschia claudopus TaxID=2862362 RepID=A0AAW0CDU1_9AGAR
MSLPAATVEAKDNTATLSDASQDPSFGPAPAPKSDSEQGDIYDRLSPRRKAVITAVVSFCGFLAPMSSTAVLSAIPEVASAFNTTGTIVGLTNAIYLVFMGISPCFWAPLSQVYGRRWISLSSAFLFFVCSLGTALSPNLAAFFIFRALTAFQGTSFLIIGTSCIGDMYRPTERATALGWYLSGAIIGPAIGPFIGGVIVTYRSWRVIFYLQTAFGGLATILVCFFQQETIHRKRSEELLGLPVLKKARLLWQWTNPIRVFKLYRYPNFAVASAMLVWTQYSILTPIRYIINPRFGLKTPIQSALFYLAPGLGSLAGTFVGGRWADHTVKQWMRIRGTRVPEDRLRSCLPFLGALVPGSILIYGWSIEKRAGGIPLPVIVMFLQGCGQLICFPSLNAYFLDVMQSRSAEAVASNYMARYLLAAVASAVVLPAVEGIGVGWFSTITMAVLVLSAAGIYATILWGESWRDTIQRKQQARGEKEEKVPVSESVSIEPQCNVQDRKDPV